MNTTEQSLAQWLARYAHLAQAAKAFIFTVLIEDGHAVRTIRYPGCAQVTGYTEAEFFAQPLLWFTMIHR